MRRALAIAVVVLAMLGLGTLTVLVVAHPRTTDGRHPPVSVAFIGDSYTVGFGASAPARRWTTLVARHYGWAEHNVGIGGTGYLRLIDQHQAYADQALTAAALHPDIVVISGGLNDLTLAVEQPQQELSAIIGTFARVQQLMPHVRIVAISPFQPAEFITPAVLTNIGDAVAQTVRTIGGAYLDVGDPLHARTADMSADHLHPNDAGYAVLARAVERAYDKA